MGWMIEATSAVVGDHLLRSESAPLGIQVCGNGLGVENWGGSRILMRAINRGF